MGHQFTIESDEAFRLASQLAGLTGQSIEAAVTSALRQQVNEAMERKATVDRWMKMTADLRTQFGDDPPSSDHSYLYDDETGLPG